MADQSVIKEFLVSLGFKVEGEQLRNAESAVASFSKGVTAIVGAVGALAAAAAVALEETAKKLEGLFYASQQAGARAENLLVMEQAYKKIGLSAEQADADAKNFNQTLLTQPGIQKYFEQLTGHGIDFSNPLNNIISLVETLDRKFPGEKLFYIRSQIASMFHIPPDELISFEKNMETLKREAAEAAEKQRATGAGSQKAAEQAAEFRRRLSALKDTFTDLVTAMSQPIIGGLLPYLEDLDKWVTAHLPEIVRAFTSLPSTVQSAFNEFKLTPFFAVLESIEEHIKAVIAQLDFKPVSSALYDVLGAFGDLGRSILELGRVLRDSTLNSPDFWVGVTNAAKSTLALITGALHDIADAIKVVADLLAGRWKDAWTDATKIFTDSWDAMKKAFQPWQSMWDGFINRLERSYHQGMRGLGIEKESFTGGTGGLLHLADYEENDQRQYELISAVFQLVQAMDAWRQSQQGEQPGGVGGGGAGGAQYEQATFRTPVTVPRGHIDPVAIRDYLAQALGVSQAAASGVVGNLSQESGLNPAAVGASGDYGLAQWLGARKRQLAEFAAQAGEDMSDPLVQLNFLVDEVKTKFPAVLEQLKRAHTAGEASDIFEQGYEKPAPGPTAQSARRRALSEAIEQLNTPTGGVQPAGSSISAMHRAVHVNQENKTTINVHGGGDPHEAARQVEAHQRNIHSNSIQNLMGIIDSGPVAVQT